MSKNVGGGQIKYGLHIIFVWIFYLSLNTNLHRNYVKKLPTFKEILSMILIMISDYSLTRGSMGKTVFLRSNDSKEPPKNADRNSDKGE